MAKAKTPKTLSDMPYLAEQVLANPREQEWFNRMSTKWGGQYARMLLQRKMDLGYAYVGGKLCKQ